VKISKSVGIQVTDYGSEVDPSEVDSSVSVSRMSGAMLLSTFCGIWFRYFDAAQEWHWQPQLCEYGSGHGGQYRQL